MQRLIKHLAVLTAFVAGWFVLLLLLSFSGLSIPRLKRVEQRIMAYFHLDKVISAESLTVSPPVRVNVVPEATTKIPGVRTPFIEWLGDHGGLVLHPFIGFTRVQHVPESELDYFGFRNKDGRIYFSRPEGKLVVLTGNSEAAGSFHKKSMAQSLEEKLNQRSTDKWHVVNLAMNNYSLPYEIGAYVYLGYHLKPEYVISHSFCGDFCYGMHVPREFVSLGLTYFYQFEMWDLQAAGLKPFAGAGVCRDCTENHEFIVDAYLRNAEKYRDIVHGNQGHFILGIQSFNFGYKPLPSCLAPLHKELLSKLPDHDLDYINFSQYPYDFMDWVHTTEAGAEMTAEIYCNHILRHAAATLKGSPISP